MLLRLQRLAGNRAVSQLLEPRLPASVQRATLGWEGAEEDSWNKGEQTVTAEGTKAKPGEAGALRIPVSGISAGRTGAMKGETGGSSDPNIGAKLREINKADPEIRAGRKPPLKDLAVSSVTSEAAAADTGGEAIVIVPPGLPTGPVDVLFHLHGHTIGYRQAKPGKGAAPPPRDVQFDRIEQQLLAAAGSGLPMVGILPQGTFYSRFGADGQAGVNVSAYVDDVFALGLKELAGRSPGRVTLSGWSGAGLGITQMIAGSEAVAAGKKVGKSGSLLPTSGFEGLFLFDAIYGKWPKAGNWLTPVWDLLQKQLHADLTSLTTEAAKNPSAPAAAQDAWLAKSGFRFRGIYTESGGCKKNYETLRDQLLEQTWFAKQEGLPASVLERWKANYQVAYSGAGVEHNQMIGKQGGPNQENLLKALEMLPRAAAPKATQGRAAPIPTRSPTPPRPRAAVTPAAGAVSGSDDLLVAGAVALGRADSRLARSSGGTLLLHDEIRSALGSRSKDAILDSKFREAQTIVAAVPAGAGRVTSAQQQAPALVRALELRFILDPSHSALDLLPPERAKHWRDFQWDPKDYPGGPKGKHEAEARAMMREMTAVRAERRPNTGSTAVVIKSEMTPERWRYIRQHSHTVPGESRDLFDEAGGSFVRMREAAKADGVKLRILSGYRDPEVAAANAAKAGNPEAVASFSSHSLGLAADLEMWGGKNEKGEMSTAVMEKVVDMRATAAHKWMVFRGEEFGWYPYGNEPWHWEYNPPGLKDHYFTAPAASPHAAATKVKAAPAKVKAAPAAAPPVANKPAAPAPQAAAAGGERLSGAHWVEKYRTEPTLDLLVEPFKSNISSFIAMLRSNQSRVAISATYRAPQRAWLMHWAWMIATGKIKYAKLNSISNPLKLDIVWDHGDEASSREAARAMVSGYHMAHVAALSSRHTEGRAVDITIRRLPEILKIDKQEYPIGVAKADANEALWFVGEHLFSVKKLASDPPHWSDDGH